MTDGPYDFARERIDAQSAATIDSKARPLAYGEDVPTRAEAAADETQ